MTSPAISPRFTGERNGGKEQQHLFTSEHGSVKNMSREPRHHQQVAKCPEYRSSEALRQLKAVLEEKKGRSSSASPSASGENVGASNISNATNTGKTTITVNGPAPSAPHEGRIDDSYNHGTAAAGTSAAAAKLWSYDCRKRLNIIFLNECGIIYEHRYPRHVRLKNELLQEMVFGSVALNCSPQSPVSKMHELSKDLIMISTVFGVQPTPSNSPDGKCSRSSSGLGEKRKFALVVIFDTSPDTYIKEFIYNHFHLIDCFMVGLRQDLLAAVLRNSTCKVLEATSTFFKALNNVLCAQILSTNITLQDYVRELITLIKQIDTKTTNFFLSTLMSAILVYKRGTCSGAGLQVIITSESKRELMSRLLIVLQYFVRGFSVREQTFQEPEINVKVNNSSSPNVQCPSSADCPASSSSKAETALETQDLSETKKCDSVVEAVVVRKSRDESLGYGSLTESGSSQEINICGEEPESLFTEASSPRKSEILDQSKLYIKEYQSLRFGKINGTLDTEPERKLSTQEKRRVTDSCASSGFGDDEECCDSSQELSPSKHIPGFGETPFPKVAPLRSSIVNELTGEPVIGDSYLTHFKLQGILLNKKDSLVTMVKKCGYPHEAKIVISADLDNWIVKVTSLRSNSTVPAVMSTWVGQMCESLLILESIGMNSQFIFDFMETRINELRRKGQIYKKMNTKDYPIWSDTTSMHSFASINSIIEKVSSPCPFSLLKGLDASDLDLISDKNEREMFKGKTIEIAETSL